MTALLHSCQFLLLTGVAILGYTWLLYPMLLALAARLFGRISSPASAAELPSGHLPRRGDAATSDLRPPTSYFPFLHIILSAYNEAAVIRERLDNLAQLDYPADRLSVHIGTDGCTDDTAELVRGCNPMECGGLTPLSAAEESGVKPPHSKALCAKERMHLKSGASLFLYEFSENRGKPAVLKDLVAVAIDNIKSKHIPPISDIRSLTSDLLVFTDANTMFAPDALRRLVCHFADPAIGGVCGRLILRPSDFAKATSDKPTSDLRPRTSAPEGSYWQFETRLKIWESALDSCLGANGAIYAIRPELFWSDLPANTIVDDFIIGMKVRERGKRMLYEPAAVAMEALPPTRAEWTRRVRIGAGDYQAVSLCRRCLRPVLGWFAWSYLSHKVLRWFTPQLLLLTAVAAFTGSVVARMPSQLSAFGPRPFVCDLVSLGVIGVLLLWSISWVVERKKTASAFGLQLSALRRTLSLLSHFLTMQAALLVGFIKYCRGSLHGAWARTNRL